MDQIKLLSITDKYPGLLSQGFTKVKQCGNESRGLLIVIGAGYIESLILSQGNSLNNFIFLYPYYESKSILDCPCLSDYLDKIYKKEASHENFVKDLKSNPILVLEVLNFVDQIFDLSENDSVDEIFRKLEEVSYNFNVQFKFYRNQERFSEVIQNSCINATVINILIKTNEENQTFHLLYHLNYSVIHENNLNLSDQYLETFPENPEIAEIEQKIRTKITQCVQSKEILKVNREELSDLMKILGGFSTLADEIRAQISELLGDIDS